MRLTYLQMWVYWIGLTMGLVWRSRWGIVGLTAVGLLSHAVS